MRVQSKVVIIVYLGALIASCAQPVSPKGGPRDEDPPTIDRLSSTPNEQVYFEKQDIKIVFNEFVTVTNPNTTVLVSPPMAVNPHIYERGKEIRIEFPEDEKLKENATYVINFGDAIKDYTEGNEIENFSFIFSTGPYIDSLSIQGVVKDAFTGEPAEETLVMLYDVLEDSIVYKERPFYFARTDEDGSYSIQNMRADTFKIIALKDENVNYIYDLDTEKIGFIDSLIVVSDSMDQIKYDLKTFSPIPEFDLVEYDAKKYGETILLFNQEADSISVSSSIDMEYFDVQQQGDSLIVWYNLIEDSGFSLFIEKNNGFRDTLKIRKTNKSDFLKKATLSVESKNFNTKKILKPYTALTFDFNYPIEKIDTTLISIVSDSIEIVGVNYSLDSLQPHRLTTDYQFNVDSTYQIVLDSSAIESIFGVVNDSTAFEFTIGNNSAYGKLLIRFDSTEVAAQYLLELMLKEKVVRRSVISDFSQTLVYDYIDPETYSLRIIKDDNKNGKWDPGSYNEKRFSELITNKPLEAVREGWENEVLISSDIFTRIEIEPVEDEMIKEKQ